MNMAKPVERVNGEYLGEYLNNMLNSPIVYECCL